MNYPLRAAVLGLLMGPGTPHSGPQIAPLSIRRFARQLDSLLKLYPRENVYSMLNLLGSHDTERLRTLLGDNLEKLKLAYSILYAYPGAPCMYYGDEIGLTGGRDPDCRGAFPWEPETWQDELHSWIQKLISLRKRSEALRRGDFKRLRVDSQNGCYAFARRLGRNQVVVAINASPAPQEICIGLKSIQFNQSHEPLSFLGNADIRLFDRKMGVSLPEWGVAWISLLPL